MERLNLSNLDVFTFKDISLERLYGVLFTLCELHSDYSFYIIRYPKYYELNFKAWGDAE